MSVKSTKRKQQKRNQLARDLHFLKQREDVIAEQLGIYDWDGW